MGVGRLQDRRILENVPIPVALLGTLGIDTGPASDGVHVGSITASAIGAALACDYAATPVYTNETTAANNATANDMNLLPASPAANDAYLFGFDNIACGMALTIGTKAVSFVGTMVAEYSKSDGTFATLTLLTDQSEKGMVDGTGAKVVLWEPPSAWGACTISSLTKRWVRFRCSEFTSIGTVPLGTRVYGYELDHGSGLKVPLNGALSRVQWQAATVSGSTADSVFAVINVTKGTMDTFTLTKATVAGEVTGLNLGFARGDVLAIKQLSEDGTTEFANVQLWLHFDV